MSLKVTQDRVQELLEAIALLTHKEVLVGIPDDAPERRDGNTVSNAQLGYIHEYGAPAANIPARPFLVPGVQDAQSKVIPHLLKAVKAAVTGDQESVDTALNAAGLVAQSSAQAKINKGNFTPLAPSTIAARKRKGDDSPKPLVDTGQLRNSITYVVKEK